MSPKGQVTLAAIQEAMETKQSRPLLAVASLLNALTVDGDRVSLADLVDMLKCDTPMIARILSLANLVGTAPSIQSVNTLSRAIHILGLDRLRSLVLSAVLSEHADSDNSVQRDMSVLSLTSGLMAQSLAAQCGDEPEPAFVCGALRHYGDVMLATLHPERFVEASQPGNSIDREFGLPSSALTAKLLADANLPAELFEPASTVNTGSAGGDKTVARPDWI